jgi:hypothetical protein
MNPESTALWDGPWIRCSYNIVSVLNSRWWLFTTHRNVFNCLLCFIGLSCIIL